MENVEVPFGYAKDGKLYRSGWSDHEDREIGEVRDDDIQKSAAFFTERFDILKGKVDEVVSKIEATENKGSFLMKLLHLKEQLPEHDGLGDYSQLLETIERHEAFIKDIIQKNRARNTEIKNALMLEMQEAVEAVNWREATEKVNDIKSRWIKTGAAEEDKNEGLEAAFWEVVKSFFDRKKNFYEDKQKLLEHRKKKYEELVKEASEINKLSGKERFEKVKSLRESWKSVGGVPNEIFKPLVTQFNEHLRAKSQASSINYSDILKQLVDVKDKKSTISSQELESIKKNIYKDRRRSDSKREVLELIGLLTEREFIDKLTKKRFKDFEKLDADKKKSIRTGILKDLISRDKQELKTYEENSANFSSTDGNFDKLVQNKLKSQKKKIELKNKLLEWVEKGDF